MPLSYENVRPKNANLPPEIANFMSRVRNASIDNSDGSVRSEVSAGGGKIASVKSPSRAADVGSRQQGVSVTKDKEDARQSKEETSLYDTLDGAKEEDAALVQSDLQTGEQPTLVLHSNAGRSVNDDPQSPKSLGEEQTDSPQTLKEDSAWFEKAQLSPVHKQPVLSSSHMPEQVSKSHAKSTSLPRGQVGNFSHISTHHQQQHRSESMSSSHSSARHARSDMVAPVYPQEREQHPSASQSFWSQQSHPQQQQQQQQRWAEGNIRETGDLLSKVHGSSLVLA